MNTPITSDLPHFFKCPQCKTVAARRKGWPCLACQRQHKASQTSVQEIRLLFVAQNITHGRNIRTSY